MRKAFLIVLLLFIALMFYQLVIVFFTMTHTIDYSLSKKEGLFRVREKYKKGDKEGYYFLKVEQDKKKFFFDIDNTFNKRKKIIKDIAVYDEDGVMCISPIYVKEVKNNYIYCNYENKQYSYEALKNKIDIEKLKSLAKFNASLYKSNLNKPIEKNGVLYYVQNAKRDEHISLYRYKFIEMYNEVSINRFTFSDKDIYNNKMGLFVDKYFLMPVYTETNTIKGYHITDFAMNRRSYFLFDDYLSLNSYMQGTVKGRVYIVDKTNKTQYMINPKKDSYEIIGSPAIDAQIFDGEKFKTTNIQSLINDEIVFPKEKVNTNEEYVESFYDERAIYLYKKNGDFIKIYKDSPEEKIHLFNNPQAKAIVVSKGSIYFIIEDLLYRYDEFGLKPLIKYNELKFNLSNIYGAYNN